MKCYDGAMRSAAALAVVFVALWPCDGLAQGRQEAGTLGMEQRHKAQVVRPLPPAAEVEQDAEQAIEELRAQQRREENIRKTLPQIKPPYADPDVRGGIQSQNIIRALPRR